MDATGRIVVYSVDPLLAARAWFTLDYLGQGGRVSLLDGGFGEVDGGRIRGHGRNVACPSRIVRSAAGAAAVVRLQTMRELVRLREQLGTSLVLIDARSPEQFCGDVALSRPPYSRSACM